MKRAKPAVPRFSFAFFAPIVAVPVESKISKKCNLQYHVRQSDSHPKCQGVWNLKSRSGSLVTPRRLVHQVFVIVPNFRVSFFWTMFRNGWFGFWW